MARKTSEIINSIHKKSKSISEATPKTSQTQPMIVSGASKIQTKAFEKIACAVAEMAAGTGGVPTSRSIVGVDSIQGGGDLTADRTLSLINDELAPGTFQYYGTDGVGAKGYHDLPGAGTGTDLDIAARTDETLNITSSTGADVMVPAATQFLAGLMTADDKTKLDGVQSGAEANVQADWNEVNPLSDAYILNKPSIPTDTGIIYSLADGTTVVATVGDRGVASAGVGADKAYETSQTIDPLTGNTIDQTFEGGNVNFVDTVITNTDSTINNVNTITNNDEDSDINNNGNTITNTGTIENNVGVTENYDNTSTTNNNGNTTNNTDVIENWDGDNVINLEDGASIINNLDGTVNNNYGDTYEENNDYEDGSTFNYTGDVENNYDNYNEENNYTDSEVTNNGGTFNYNDVNVNYDEDSEVTFEGDIYLGGDIINTFNESNNGTVAVEVGPGVSWTDIANALDCDGVDAVSTPIDPTLLDNVSLVVADVITGNIKTNSITSGLPATYGGASDLRGTTLTPAQVNAADFGAVFKFGDSAYIKVTGFNFAIPLTNTILGAKVNVIFTSTPTSVNVDCITMIIYHTDNSEFTSGVSVQEAGVDVTQATTINFQSGAVVTDMGGGVVNVEVAGGTGGVAYYEEYTAIGGETTIPLTNMPAGENWIWLSTESGLYGKKGPTRDFTYDNVANEIEMNYALGAGDVVNIQYIGSTIAPLNTQNIKRSGNIRGAGGTTFTIADASIHTDSAILLVVTSGTQAGYRQTDVSEGSMTITSTASEDSALEFTYYIISDHAVTASDYVSDEVYGPTWENETVVAPSKNAVFDKIESLEGEIGLVGGDIVAGTTEVAGQANTERTTLNMTYTKFKEILIKKDGTYTVSYELSGTPSYGRIYKNGVAYGIEQYSGTGGYQLKTEDLSFEFGDLLQLYARTDTSGNPCGVQNLKVTYTIERDYGEVILD